MGNPKNDLGFRVVVGERIIPVSRDEGMGKILETNILWVTSTWGLGQLNSNPFIH